MKERTWAGIGMLLAMAVSQLLGQDLRLASPPQTRRIAVSDYLDKMQAGWIGQMCGVGLGGPTEFKAKGTMYSQRHIPTWQPKLVNQFDQDDIYVEMTFIRTLEQNGLDVSIRQAGIDFARSRYRLWHANEAGRNNLRNGIAPPDSGHPQFNKHADDIDYQIEADFSGLIAPGMPELAIELGQKFGRLMNYGDGLYGGQFIGGMYTEAFFETDPLKIVEAGLRCIPSDSQYAECIRDVVAWYKAHPDDYAATWKLVDQKYQRNPAYRRFSCNKGDFNIDAKINGAYVVMGMLYGKGDLDKTMFYAILGGQDSDCNASSAAGVMFTTLGLSRLPDKFTSELEKSRKFVATPYDYPALVAVCEKLARAAVVRAGGRVEKDAQGQEFFVIPVRTPNPGPAEQSWSPGPAANSKWSDEEKALITNGPAAAKPAPARRRSQN